ncbi:MAG TPA: hypothetical protein DEH78_27485 [Solibacterales bacterium]|nr:hypothetical protein [Bryobacterales bacterium]
MHSLEALELYTQFHDRWFESPVRYVPSDEYLQSLAGVIPACWRVERDGLWYSVTPPGLTLPDHGWKLHIAASSGEAAEVLRRAAEVLRAEPAPFKFLLDRRITALSNGKLWHRGSSGKFLTVYPSTMEQFHALGGLLALALVSISGPYVLSDRRWPGSSCVSYRYGGFASRTVLQADGTRRHVLTGPDGSEQVDARLPYWAPPAWASDPFPDDPLPPVMSRSLCGGRFVVQSALAFSNRGGVYRAEDRDTGQPVVLKEARPRVEIGASRLDAITVLEKEHRLLERLAGSGYFVRPVALFRDWEHAFLAEEFVPGTHLGLFSLRNNPLYAGNITAETLAAYLERMRGLWLQVAQAIAAAHERGVVLGDLSFTNILVGDDHHIRICDLESAAQEGVDAPVGLYTPGMSVAGVTERANDYYSLGALMLGSVFLVHGLTGFHAPLRSVFLDELQRDLATPADLRTLIDDLMTKPEEFSATPARAIEAIGRLPARSGQRHSSRPRLGRSLARRFDGESREALRARVKRRSRAS